MTELDETARARHAQGLPPIREPDAETAPVTREVPTDRPADPPDPSPLEGVVLDRQDGPRPPILPAWMRSWGAAADRTKTVIDDIAYICAAHAINSPVYLARCARWAPIGYARTVRGLWRWGWDRDLVADASAQTDASAKDTLWKEADRHRRHRLPVMWPLLVLLLGSPLAACLWLPWWALIPAGLATVVVLGLVGRPPDRPIAVRIVLTEPYVRLTAEMVRDALCSIGIAKMRDPEDVKFPQEIHRDGPGMLARVNLPRGVEAVEVCEREGKLSSALRLPRDQVWPSGGPEHDGQLDLWVGYQPASKMRQPKWAITADNAVTSVFEPIPFGTDARMRPVAEVLFERSWLIGGRPGSGKSYFTRAIALGAALDPTAEFKIAEFKGVADFGDFDEAGLCSEFHCGVDDEAFGGGADMTAWALAEAERRGKLIRRERAKGNAPLGKVTPELAAAGIGLHPVLIIIDEAHELLVDKDVADDLERVIKRSRALNLIVLISTQIPDKDSIPPNITRCVNMRACLAVRDHHSNNMILGTGAHQRGVTATGFRPGKDAGWAMVDGLEEPVAARSYFPDAAETKAILERARILRGGRPVTSEAHERVEILVEVLRVWPAGQAGAHWEDLAGRLAKARPDVYRELTGDSLSALLRGLDVPSQNVKVDGTVRKGCRRDAIEAAARRRELGHG